MSALPEKRHVSPATLLGLCFASFLTAAIAMLALPGPRSPLPSLALAAMAVTGMLAIRGLVRGGRETEQALAEAERYIEAVADLSQDIHAIIATRTRKFLYLNPAVVNLLGFSQEDFTRGGLAFFNSLVHPEDLPALQAQYTRLLVPPEPGRAPDGIAEQTFRIRDRRGIHLWFKSRMLVFARQPSGQAAELLAVIHDVTEQRSFEAALLQAQKQESLVALARGTVHDLNNTLMGIQGFTEIALDGTGNPQAFRANLEQVRASILRASSLCRQMVAYTGNGRLQIAPRQLNDAVRESLPAIESMLPQGGHLELDLEADLPLASLDLNQVHYAVLNLVFNAAEAIRVAGGEIALRTRLKLLAGGGAPEGLEGSFACLEVSHSGPGISQEVLDQVFDPLFPAKWPGHGLGLSAVAGIMREHQGAVQTAARPGGGEVATLYFPLALKVPELDPADEGTPVTGLSGVILLVDDEPTVRAILRQGLEQAGFKVLEAADGVDGVAAFVRHRSAISLVLLDLTMPRMGGDLVFREIRKLAPALPVVLMSGYSEQEATSALASQGLAGFLPKPCSIRDVLEVVRRALGLPQSEPTLD